MAQGCLLPLFGAALVAWLCGSAIEYIAKRTARWHRWHRLTQRGLGLAVVVSVLITSLLVGVLMPDCFKGVSVPLFIGAFGVVSLVGWLNNQVPPRFRTLLWIGWLLPCYLACLANLTIDSIKLPFTTYVQPLGSLRYVVTVLWLWAVTAVFSNTVKVRGLPLGIGAVTGATFLSIALTNPLAFAPQAAVTLSAMVVGICLGLMPLCFKRQMNLGVGGTAVLGFALALTTVAGALKNTAFLIIVLPLMALGIPFIETTYGVVKLAHTGASTLTLAQRRASFYELLRQEGLGELKAFSVLTSANAYLCVLALLLTWLVWMHFAFKILLMLVWLGFGALLFLCIVRLLVRRPPLRSVGVTQTLQESVNLLGIPIAALSMEETLQRIESFLQTNTPHIVVTSDTSSLMRAQQDKEFGEIVRHADLVTADGMGLVVGARLLGLPLYERVSGVDLMGRLCGLAASKGYRIFLLGAQPGVAEEAARRLQQYFAGLQIVGVHHGYFSPDEEPAVIEKIRQAKPHILLVALGIPKQEKWMAHHARDLNVPVCMGVGGSFDVYAGKAKRAPAWVQKMGLEWLYRTIRDPRRLPRLIAIPKFLLLVAAQALKGLARLGKP